MTNHVHEAEKHDPILALDWCACGWERDKSGRWRYPRTLEGFIRRARSVEEES